MTYRTGKKDVGDEWGVTGKEKNKVEQRRTVITGKEDIKGGRSRVSYRKRKKNCAKKHYKNIAL